MVLLEESLTREFWRNQAEAQRCEAKTASGSAPETLPTAIQPIRLTSAPAKNEIAAQGMNPRKRRTNASGPFKTSPMRMSQPDPCSWIARLAAPFLSRLSQIKSVVSTAAAKNPIALSGAKRIAPRFSKKTAAEHRRERSRNNPGNKNRRAQRHRELVKQTL